MGLHLPNRLKQHGVVCRGLIHVGAHFGQEAPLYATMGAISTVWIEPIPEVYAQLVKNLPRDERTRAFNVACGPSRSVATMHVHNAFDGQSSSLLPGSERLSEQWPELRDGVKQIDVPVVPLDELMRDEGLRASDYNVLVLDTQGYELPCLRGAEAVLKGCDAVASEVSAGEFYKGGTLVGELDAFLKERGFVRCFTNWEVKDHGDALYVRPERLPMLKRLRIKVFGGREKVK